MTQRTANQILDAEFLTIRCDLLNLAAALDRIERADGDVSDDERMQLIRRGIERLSGGGPDRARDLQLLFSDEYANGWNKSA